MRFQREKEEKNLMRKMGMRLGSILFIYWQESVQRLLHGVASIVVAWKAMLKVFFSLRETCFQATCDLHPREFGIP